MTDATVVRDPDPSLITTLHLTYALHALGLLHGGTHPRLEVLDDAVHPLERGVDGLAHAPLRRHETVATETGAHTLSFDGAPHTIVCGSPRPTSRLKSSSAGVLTKYAMVIAGMNPGMSSCLAS